jgi:hypothetical protein
MRVFQFLGLQEKLQLSGIEPDPLAIRTVVNFDLIVLDHYHNISTDRAFH